MLQWLLGKGYDAQRPLDWTLKIWARITIRHYYITSVISRQMTVFHIKCYYKIILIKVSFLGVYMLKENIILMCLIITLLQYEIYCSSLVTLL